MITAVTDAAPKLLGSYWAPAFRIGGVVACARRGEVRIIGLSEAPIPWPKGQLLKGGRRPELILDADLAKAVRRESAEAVMHSPGGGALPCLAELLEKPLDRLAPGRALPPEPERLPDALPGALLLLRRRRGAA